MKEGCRCSNSARRQTDGWMSTFSGSLALETISVAAHPAQPIFQTTTQIKQERFARQDQCLRWISLPPLPLGPSDVCVFLRERSKALHRSELSHDTTQSQQGSWCTQCGIRTFAFWTMHTQEGDFVVCGSHKQAAERLNTRGRDLNYRESMVSPSCSRRLDRAARWQQPEESRPKRKCRPH